MSEGPTVTVVFPFHGRTGTIKVPWIRGKSVQRYLHEQPLKQYSLMAKRMTHKMYNRKGHEVKLWYLPTLGDAITFVQVRRSKN